MPRCNLGGDVAPVDRMKVTPGGSRSRRRAGRSLAPAPVESCSPEASFRTVCTGICRRGHVLSTGGCGQRAFTLAPLVFTCEQNLNKVVRASVTYSGTERVRGARDHGGLAERTTGCWSYFPERGLLWRGLWPPSRARRVSPKFCLRSWNGRAGWTHGSRVDRVVGDPPCQLSSLGLAGLSETSRRLKRRVGLSTHTLLPPIEGDECLRTLATITRGQSAPSSALP